MRNKKEAFPWSFWTIKRENKYIENRKRGTEMAERALAHVEKIEWR